MPVILNLLRTRPDQITSKAEIQAYAYPIIHRGLAERPQALGWALTYLTKEGLIARPRQGFYKILPSGLAGFTEDDGKRLTEKYEKR